MNLPQLLALGLASGVIVGFVTASIKSWVDRFFLVILLVGLLGRPIHEAIVINLVVVSLAALTMLLRQREVIEHANWRVVIVPAVLGGAAARALAIDANPKLLIGLLGGYAILVGLRMLLIKPIPERDDPLHERWIAPVAALSGAAVGLLSAGGKPFTVPLYNVALGHHPRQAYAHASLAVVSGAWAALFTQVGLGHPLEKGSLLLALYLFTVIGLTALAVGKLWTPKLNRIVTLVVGPLLVAVGVKFLVQVL